MGAGAGKLLRTNRWLFTSCRDFSRTFGHCQLQAASGNQSYRTRISGQLPASARMGTLWAHCGHGVPRILLPCQFAEAQLYGPSWHPSSDSPMLLSGGVRRSLLIAAASNSPKQAPSLLTSKWLDSDTMTVQGKSTGPQHSANGQKDLHRNLSFLAPTLGPWNVRRRSGRLE